MFRTMASYGMNFQERFVNMLTKFIYFSGLRHRMPLIAYTTRGKDQRKFCRWRLGKIFG